MSAATKKKHVFHETVNNFVLPSETQQIVKVDYLLFLIQSIIDYLFFK